MTFLALDAQKKLYTLQKNQLGFEETIVMSRISTITSEMEYLTELNDGTDWEADEDPTYVALENEQESLETRQEALETQFSLLEQYISNLKTMVTNGIKNDCGLNLISS